MVEPEIPLENSTPPNPENKIEQLKQLGFQYLVLAQQLGINPLQHLEELGKEVILVGEGDASQTDRTNVSRIEQNLSPIVAREQQIDPEHIRNSIHEARYAVHQGYSATYPPPTIYKNFSWGGSAVSESRWGDDFALYTAGEAHNSYLNRKFKFQVSDERREFIKKIGSENASKMQFLRVVIGEKGFIFHSNGAKEDISVTGDHVVMIGGYGEGDHNRPNYRFSPLALELSFVSQDLMEEFSSDIQQDPIGTLRVYFDALWPGMVGEFGERAGKMSFPYTRDGEEFLDFGIMRLDSNK